MRPLDAINQLCSLLLARALHARDVMVRTHSNTFADRENPLINPSRPAPPSTTHDQAEFSSSTSLLSHAEGKPRTQSSSSSNNRRRRSISPAFPPAEIQASFDAARPRARGQAAAKERLLLFQVLLAAAAATSIPPFLQHHRNLRRGWC